MSFPPNLGITNSFLIDSNCSLVFQDFPSLLPQLEHLCSPFSKHKMNGYSRIKSSCRSKSVDFADLSLTHHAPKFDLKPTLSNDAKIATIHSSIPEEENGESEGELFGIILGRKCSVSSGRNDQKSPIALESAAVEIGAAKRSFSVRRSASVSEGYSRIHHQSDLTAEDDGEVRSSDANVKKKKKKKKKKGKYFRAFRRLFGL